MTDTYNLQNLYLQEYDKLHLHNWKIYRFLEVNKRESMIFYRISSFCFVLDDYDTWLVDDQT